MPYVSLPGSVSLYYEHVGEFDASRPTVVCLSPAMHSITLLGPMLSNPAWANWNKVLLDLRFHGRGSAPKSSAYTLDFAVHAADVAFAMEKLGLPPSHFYCPEVSAFHTGTHLAILFPDVVLSLTFCGVYSLLTPQSQAREIFGEIDSFIVFPETEASFMDGIEGLVEMAFGQPVSCFSAAIADVVANGFVRRYNPNMVRYLPHTSPLRQPFRLRPEHLALIECPVLVMHGELDLAHPPAAAVEFYTALTACPDRQLYIIPSGPHCADLTHEPLVTARMASFLAPFGTAPVARTSSCTINRDLALSRLAHITADETVRERDGTISDSFCSMSAETLAVNTEWIRECRYRAAHYRVFIHGEGTAEPWEQPVSSGWSFSRRHDFTRSQVQAEQHHRRASGNTVEITCVKQVSQQELSSLSSSDDERCPGMCAGVPTPALSSSVSSLARLEVC